MEKRIETLEELDLFLSKQSLDIGAYWAKTDMELLAWKLLAHIAFDTDLLLKGTRARFEEPRDLPDDYKDQQWKQYGGQFSADNKALRQWLSTTPLEHVAGFAGYLVRRYEIDRISNYYDPAQDFYADHWREFDKFTHGAMSGREFVKSLYDQIDEVNAHIAEGKSLGLTMDEIVLHDCTWGLLPSNYDPDMITAVKDMLKEAERLLPDRPYIWSEQGMREFAPRMLEYADSRLKDFGVDINLHKGYTTEQGYLLDYFSRLYWREAASKPED